MKNFIKLILVFSILATLFIFNSVFAADVDVQLNGEIIDFTDSDGNKVNAQIINDRTMVPLRKIFEELGCEIIWNANTRSVMATKDNKQVILQIDNREASKFENGIEQKIKLDVAPMIVNDRTLVPLRFIAESLGKQVGWDASSYTAVIIDYDYFTNLVKKENINLYNMLTSKSDNVSFSIIRNYTDLSNSLNSNSATINGTITKNGEGSSVNINFEGTNELINEIKKEGWGSISYNVKYDKNAILINTQNDVFAKMLELDVNTYNVFNTETLGLAGGFEDDLSEVIRNIFNIDERKINIYTFNSMKSDFNRALKLFFANGTRNFNYDNAKFVTFDYTRFDNVVYGNEVFANLSLINKEIFNSDLIQDELLYDWSNINYIMNCENENLVLKLALENEYNEKVSYTIVFKSN